MKIIRQLYTPLKMIDKLERRLNAAKANDLIVAFYPGVYFDHLEEGETNNPSSDDLNKMENMMNEFFAEDGLSNKILLMKRGTGMAATYDFTDPRYSGIDDDVLRL